MYFMYINMDRDYKYVVNIKHYVMLYENILNVCCSNVIIVEVIVYLLVLVAQGVIVGFHAVAAECTLLTTTALFSLIHPLTHYLYNDVITVVQLEEKPLFILFEYFSRQMLVQQFRLLHEWQIKIHTFHDKSRNQVNHTITFQSAFYTISKFVVPEFGLSFNYFHANAIACYLFYD